MTTASISHINSLRDRLSIAIFFGSNYRRFEQPYWTCDITYHENDTKVKLKAGGDSPNEVVLTAYNKLHAIIADGLGPQALLPSMDHTVAAIAALREPDDEIPF
jgi:hypothetical protein